MTKKAYKEMCRTPQALGPSLVQDGGDQANGYPSKDITAHTTTQNSDTIKALSLIESPMNHCLDDGRTNRIFLSTVHYRLSEIELPRNWITGARHCIQPIGDETSDHYETWFSS